MNWDYFFMFVFAMFILQSVAGIIAGTFKWERDAKYDTGSAVVGLILLIFLVLMWFWT